MSELIRQHHVHRVGEMHRGSAESESTARLRRASQEPGRSLRLCVNMVSGRDLMASWLVGVELVPTRANTESTRSTRSRGESRSGDGWTEGSRSSLMVPRKRENSAKRIPSREASCQIMDPLEGKNVENTESR